MGCFYDVLESTQNSLRFCFHHGYPIHVGAGLGFATIARPPFHHTLQPLVGALLFFTHQGTHHHPWWGENHCHHFTSLGLFDLPCGEIF
jgi:hypothetical protein